MSPAPPPPPPPPPLPPPVDPLYRLCSTSCGVRRSLLLILRGGLLGACFNPPAPVDSVDGFPDPVPGGAPPSGVPDAGISGT